MLFRSVSAQEIGQRVKELCPAGGSVAVLGHEPEIYFYSQRRPATRYTGIFLFTQAMKFDLPYGMDMAREMTREIEASGPGVLVLVNDPTSWWGCSTEGKAFLMGWFLAYQRKQYQQVGLIEMTGTETEGFWGEEALNRTPASASWIGGYRKKY